MFVLPQDVLLFCQIFGGFPFKCTKTSKRDERMTFSLGVFLWGLVVIVLQTVLSFVTLYLDYIGKLAGRPIRMADNASVMAVSSDVISLNLMAVIVFVISAWNHHNFLEMCLILGRVDQTLGMKLNKRKISLKVILIFTLMIILIPLTLLGLETLKHVEDLNYKMAYYIPFLTMYCSQAALFLQFTHVTQSIARRFRMVNGRIKEDLLNQEFGHLVMRKTFLRNEVNSGDTSSVSKIRTLTDLYWLLCEALGQANTFYSSQLLAAMFSSFVHIIMTLYYFFLHIWPTIDPKEWLYLSIQGIWVVVHSSHLLLIVWPSTDVTDAANETAPMICKIINSELHHERRQKLDTFLLQLLHHKARFTAQGYFQIHNHILSSIAGSVTTYLVILIQFQTSPSQQAQTCPS